MQAKGGKKVPYHSFITHGNDFDLIVEFTIQAAWTFQPESSFFFPFPLIIIGLAWSFLFFKSPLP